MWIFGYGSLVWKPGFDFEEVQTGYIQGWARRFWQGSTDHRGVPNAPGRVVTLVARQDEITWGRVYRIPVAKSARILEVLDIREQGGYDRLHIPVYREGGVVVAEEALVYRATEENPEFLGEDEVAKMAKQILGSVGPSGTNIEYLLELHDALKMLNVQDQHIDDLVRAVRALEQQ